PPTTATLFPYTTLFRSPRRARAQSEEPLGNYPAREVRRRHGRERFGQKHFGVRSDFCRRPTAFPRFDERLRAPVCGATLAAGRRSEEHTSELQSRFDLV